MFQHRNTREHTNQRRANDDHAHFQWPHTKRAYKVFEKNSQSRLSKSKWLSSTRHIFRERQKKFEFDKLLSGEEAIQQQQRNRRWPRVIQVRIWHNYGEGQRPLSFFSLSRCPYTDCSGDGMLHRPWTQKDADRDMLKQKKQIRKEGEINFSFLRGFRVPYLDTAGQEHYGALAKNGFTYDSSITIRPDDIQDGLRFWPHTLDYPVTYDCPNCPKADYKCELLKNCTLSSMWVVPMHYFDPHGKFDRFAR
jgi:hypothetical protein